MIRTSPLAKVVSFALSSALVVATAHYAFPDQKIEIAGGGLPVEARAGSAFEDMAQGVMTPDAVDDAPLTPAPPVETAKPLAAEVLPKPQVEAALQPPISTVVPAARPAQAPTVKPVPLPLAPAADAILPAVVPDVTPPQVATPSAETVAPTQTIVAETPEATAPPQSIRPQRRDPVKAAQVAAARPKPKQIKVARKQRPKQKTRRGNAKQNNTQGARNGTSNQAKARKSGQGKRVAAQAGNAARDNYPGKVMRKISRVRKPNVRARGTAVIAFRVSASGGLSGVSVARSSGSAALDQAAMRVVKKAAPFPKPPGGARRNFSIRIKGR
ncbi:TonB family protein [Sulfitobacter sp. M57]|uniref:cell envelope integrity protein TolA n=1 Tax=unclassified Sulfitobacter TaxID=196795 RepID=UPI0023E1907B|nr:MULTISPECIES: TonB family protein [unclassified Sulfitobacter]MDF3415102.1 TonB family protein [Sulfitobacter sp. KE5]MDF3422583.1 TonB family protein [Sulfitobacter sp. KE43]MDF3433648.1 TonB family protein [Sulfitobacter sp. KE42]MDF3459288.1 TonB family protein [Sulfitobacter sp. S74]MDF3463187.1 TonB family protein [Sulfitobacter sp. Ks18]